MDRKIIATNAFSTLQGGVRLAFMKKIRDKVPPNRVSLGLDRPDF